MFTIGWIEVRLLHHINRSPKLILWNRTLSRRAPAGDSIVLGRHRQLTCALRETEQLALPPSH